MPGFPIALIDQKNMILKNLPNHDSDSLLQGIIFVLKLWGGLAFQAVDLNTHTHTHRDQAMELD